MKNLYVKAVLTVILTLFFSSFHKAEAQVQTPKYVSMAANTNGYYEYLPQGYNPTGTQKYPVILFIHGMGELGNGSSDLPDILNTALPRLIDRGDFPTSFTVDGQTHRFIVISPQFVAWPQHNQIDDVLDYVLANYKADPNRIYITGLSMGGGALWDYVGNQNNPSYAERTAAIAPICGAAYPNQYKAAMIAEANLPVWAFHNNGDQTAPVSYTNDFVNYINTHNPPPAPLAKKTIFMVNGHDAWTQAYNPNYEENGKNVYEWMLTYSRNGVTPPPPTNNPPTVNAGTDKTLTLPTNSVTMTASASDPGGSIASYSWSKTAGPSQFSISSSSALNPNISNLAEGSYTFRLTVTDNQGATATDNVNISVNGVVTPPPPPPPGGGNQINVSIYGGSNPYNNTAWNNWNTFSSLTSPALKYSNGSASSVTAVLSQQTSVANNGTGYNTTMAPPEVTRYPSYSTSNRTLTISGLDNSKTYNIDLFASRKGTSNNTTRFVIGTTTVNILTDNNMSNKASFSSISPSSGSIVINLTKVNTYNYINGFTITESGTGSGSNTPPTVNAGTDRALTLPNNSLQLSATASDPDGSIASYSWVKTSGPLPHTFSSNSVANPTISNLGAGNYIFTVTVTDNLGATASDVVNVVVSNETSPPPPTGETKYIKVNLYGGSNPFNNAEWNNWNTHSSLSSGNLDYSDGNASGISAQLSHQNSVSDNTTSYATTAMPKEVGRYPSYSTNNRTLTISGLDDSRTYSLEVLGSRKGASNNTTRYTVGNSSVDVLTDNNLTKTAMFNGLTPSGGRIVLTLTRLNTYNYLNGFILTEASSGSSSARVQAVESDATVAASISVFPNPATDKIVLQVNNTYTGKMNVQVIDINGSVKKEFSLSKAQAGSSQTYLSIGDLAAGEYFIKVQIGTWSESLKFIKM